MRFRGVLETMTNRLSRIGRSLGALSAPDHPENGGITGDLEPPSADDESEMDDIVDR